MTDEKKYGIDPQVLEDTLNASQFYTGLGPQGEPALLKSERGEIFGRIFDRLVTTHKRRGDLYFSEYWLVMREQLRKANWFARDDRGNINFFYVWGCFQKLATRKAEQKMKPENRQKFIGDLIKETLQEIGKH